jgi:hypothetical protein
MSVRSILQEHARKLEDRFFLEQDRLLVEKLRELRRMEESRQALSDASGITNPAVLDRLIELGIRPELVACLSVVPLVEVAWADGRVAEKERAAVMQAAAANGMAKGKPDCDLLEAWLDHRPGTELLEAWVEYVHGLCELMQPDERDALRSELVERARHVAEAAGGFLGLTSPISKAEQHMLDTLDQAFRTP